MLNIIRVNYPGHEPWSHSWDAITFVTSPCSLLLILSSNDTHPSKLTTPYFQSFNIYTANGSVIPVEPVAASQTTTKAGTSGVNRTETTLTSGAAVGQTGPQGQTGQTITGQTEVQSTYNATIGVQYGGTPGHPLPGHPGIYHGAFVYNRAVPYYVPPKTDNPHEAATAKQFVDPRGLAKVSK